MVFLPMNSDSSQPTAGGQLFIVATPIGNLADITFRAVEILKRVHLIAAEDTRTTGRLLRRYGIKTPMVALHEHNEASMSQRILRVLQDGEDVALVSDAGTPLMSDPGYHLVAAARRADLRIVPVPGPSSITAALCASGLPPQPFRFHGFLPRSGRNRRLILQEMAGDTATQIFFESPHRLLNTLRDLSGICGPERLACVARELTKLHEEIVTLPIGRLIRHFEERTVRGECVVLLASAGKTEEVDDEAIVEHLNDESLRRLPASVRAREVAARLGISKRRVYALMHDRE